MKLAIFFIALACFATYGAALQWFFLRPRSVAWPMQAIRIGGTALAVATLGVIVIGNAPSTTRASAAAVGYAMGWCLFTWALHTAKSARLPLAFSKIGPAQIITSGPYRFMRHPMYVAYSITWLAGVIYSLNPFLAAGSLGLIGLYISAARQESRLLADGPLADAFRAYLGESLLPRRQS